jgi:ATP-dependent Clp protease ATP-binding subunit ClpA
VKRGVIGFGGAQATAAKERLTERLKDHFSPEVINRLDQICFFRPLEAVELVQIAELELTRFNERLHDYRTTLTSTDAVLQWIVAQLPIKDRGARDVRRLLRSRVEQLMSKIILTKKIKQRYALSVEGEHLVLK